MKKHLFFLTLLLCALTVGSGNVWGDEGDVTVTWSINGVVTTQNTAGGCQVNTALKTSSISPSGAYGTWTAVSDNDKSYAASSTGAQLGAGTNREFNGTITLSSTSIPETATIKSVTVNATTNGSSTLSVTVDNNSLGSNKTVNNSEATDYTVSGSSQIGNNIVIAFSGTTTSKYINIKEIEVTYTPPVETKVATPKFSPSEGTWYGTKSVSITCDTEDADIYYTLDGTTPTSSSTKFTSAISVSSSTTITAIGIKDGLEDSEEASADYTILTSIPSRLPKNYNSNYFVKVTDINDLENGDLILIVNKDGNYAMGEQNGTYRDQVAVESTNGVITDPSSAQKIVLINTDNRYFFSPASDSYIYANSSSGNNIGTNNEKTAGENAMASIEIAANGDATIVFLGDKTRNNLRYNSTNSRFSCYASTSDFPVVHIYKEYPAIRVSESCIDGTFYYSTYSDPNNAFIVPGNLIISEVSVIEGRLYIDDYTKDDVVPANTGVLVTAEEAGVYPITLSTGGTSKLGSDNFLHPGGITAAKMAEDYDPSDYLFYKLSLNNAGTANSAGFYWGAADGAAFASSANKAFLAVPKANLSGAPSVLRFIEDENTTTAIETTESAEQVTKFFQNGNLYILRDGITYDVTGRMVK